MGMLLFIGLVVVLVLWLNDKSVNKHRSNEAYWRGRYDGRQVLRGQIEPLLAEDKKSSTAIRKVIDSLDPAYNQSPTPTAQPSANQSTVVAAATSNRQPTEASVDHQQSSTRRPAKNKDQQTATNLNILLYVGSFLIVAAVGLFANLSSPAWMKLSSMIVVALLFYLAGLLLYRSSRRLGPAAIAFTGTGLATVPFIGVALHTLGGLPADVAWWVISIIGLVAYLVAAIQLKSQIVSYLSMAFLLSLALSSVATLGVNIIWYFVVLIGISLLINSIHWLAPQRIPAIFSGVMRDTGITVTPAALVASLLTIQTLDIWAYEILFGLATIHYIVIWLEARREGYEILARIIGQIWLLIVVGDLVSRQHDQVATITFILGWLMVALVQLGYSLLRLRPGNSSSRIREISFVSSMLGILVLLMPIWAAVDNSASWLALHLLVIGLAFMAVAWRFGSIGWLYGALITLAPLPFVVGRGVIDLPLSYEIIAGLYSALAFVSLLITERFVATNRPAAWRYLVITTTSLLTGLAVFGGLLSVSSLTIGWTMAVAAGLLVLLSLILKKAWLEVIGGIVATWSIAGWTWQLVSAGEWRWVIYVTASVLLLIVASAIHHHFKETKRRNNLAILAASLLILLFGVVFSAEAIVVRAAVGLLIAAGVGSFILRSLDFQSKGLLARVGLAGYIIYPVLALLVALQPLAGDLAIVLALLTIAVTQWAGSWHEKHPWMLVIGNSAFLIAIAVLWSWLQFSAAWAPFGIFWIAAAVFYGFYWLTWSRADMQRQLVSFISGLSVLGLAALVGLLTSDSQQIMAGALSLIVMAAILSGHGYLKNRMVYVETAIYVATFGVQRLVALIIPDANIVFYAHWWALTLILVALWRRDKLTRLIIALAFITLSTGGYALAERSGYSLLFLIEHLLLLVSGAMLRWQWLLWWGLVAAVIAVLYFLRDYTWLALLFLGFVMIAFVVWRLLKSSRQD